MDRTSLQFQLERKINNKTKPVGSLGRLEKIALQVGLVQKTLEPEIRNANILVFAGDHGIAATGLVNPYPQAVTSQMVLNFLNGGAAINVFCSQHQIALTVIDAGVNANLEDVESNNFVHAKIAYGTRNYLEGVAMSVLQVDEAIRRGREVVKNVIDTRNSNCIGIGEMGIGNTSSASLIMSAITSLPLSQCVGRGTGSTDRQLISKLNTLEKVYAFHKLQIRDYSPIELLSRIGGLEIAMMVGAYLQGAEEGVLMVVDGFISTSAVMVAAQIDTNVPANCIFAHTSGEKGHASMLEHLQVQPMLDLGLRLGEGTGAALAIPIIRSAVNFLNQMATFESASVSTALQ